MARGVLDVPHASSDQRQMLAQHEVRGNCRQNICVQPCFNASPKGKQVDTWRIVRDRGLGAEAQVDREADRRGSILRPLLFKPSSLFKGYIGLSGV